MNIITSYLVTSNLVSDKAQCHCFIYYAVVIPSGKICIVTSNLISDIFSPGLIITKDSKSLVSVCSSIMFHVLFCLLCCWQFCFALNLGVYVTLFWVNIKYSIWLFTFFNLYCIYCFKRGSLPLFRNCKWEQYISCLFDFGNYITLLF